ncbi:MAG: hypothetical protein ACXWP0_01195 [Ktedonobacterales bacterium]
MNTWQRVGDTPELFVVGYDNATTNTVRAVVLQYRGGGRWWVMEATYGIGRIEPTEEHRGIWKRLTPQEQAVCALQFGSASTRSYEAYFLDLPLSQCLDILAIPHSAACAADRSSPLW